MMICLMKFQSKLFPLVHITALCFSFFNLIRVCFSQIKAKSAWKHLLAVILPRTKETLFWNYIRRSLNKCWAISFPCPQFCESCPNVTGPLFLTWRKNENFVLWGSLSFLWEKTSFYWLFMTLLGNYYLNVLVSIQGEETWLTDN